MVAADRSERGPEPAESSTRTTRMPARSAAVVVAVVALVVVGIWGVLALRDGGPLAPSSDGERVLRTLRLAGFDRVWVTRGDDAVTVVVAIPGVDSPADVEIAWQTAFASLASAFRTSGDFRVGLATGEQVIAEMGGSAADIAQAVESGDAMRLRDVVNAEYVVADLSDVLPSQGEILVQATTLEDAAYLDAKNRAARLLDDEGAVPLEAERLAMECDSMRADVEGRPAVRPEEALKEYSGRIVAKLVPSDTGADLILAEIERLAAATPAGGTDGAARLRTISLVVEALASAQPYGNLLADTAAIGELVAQNQLSDGAASDAVLAAAHDSAAPETALRLDTFARADELDMMPDGDGGPIAVGAVVRAISSGVPVRLSETIVTVPSQAWQAYRRSDGSVYWRGESGTDFALTDGSLRAWAFSRDAAAIVDTEDVGVVYSLLLSDSVQQ